MAKNIQLIIGSTRQSRIATGIAKWVASQAQNNKDINLQILDLKAENLPAFDAPIPPSYAPTTTTEGKAWAAKIEAADGYIFLTPEYNRSVPASLKNAIDYLVKEWNHKPAAIVSYGYIDGGQSASRHLKDILDWLKVHTAKTTVAIQLKQDMLDGNGAIRDTDTLLAPYEASMQQALHELVQANTHELITAA